MSKNLMETGKTGSGITIRMGIHITQANAAQWDTQQPGHELLFLA